MSCETFSKDDGDHLIGLREMSLHLNSTGPPGQEQVVNIDRVNCLIFNPEIESIGERFLSMNASLEIVVVIRSAIALHRNELRISPCIQ